MFIFLFDFTALLAFCSFESLLLVNNRYPGARVTASAIWRLRIFLVRGVHGIGTHHIARDPVMGIIIPMKPAIEGAGSGRGEEGDVRVRVRGLRHTVRRVLSRATRHIGYDCL